MEEKSTIDKQLEEEIDDIFEQWWKYHNRVHCISSLPDTIKDYSSLKNYALKDLMKLSFKEGYLIRKQDLEQIRDVNKVSIWNKLFSFIR